MSKDSYPSSVTSDMMVLGDQSNSSPSVQGSSPIVPLNMIVSGDQSSSSPGVQGSSPRVQGSTPMVPPNMTVFGDQSSSSPRVQGSSPMVPPNMTVFGDQSSSSPRVQGSSPMVPPNMTVFGDQPSSSPRVQGSSPMVPPNMTVFGDQSSSSPRVQGSSPMVPPNMTVFGDQSSSSPRVQGSSPMVPPNMTVFGDQSSSSPRVQGSSPMVPPNMTVFGDQSSSSPRVQGCSPRVQGSSPMVPPNMTVSGDQSSSSSRVQGSSPKVPLNVVQNGIDRQAEMAVCFSKKLQDDLQAMGLKVKQHEDNLKFLKSETNKLDDKILDMHVALGKYHTEASSMLENEDHSHDQSDDEIVERILMHDKSAAAIYHQLLAHHGTLASNLPVAKDVVGTVATLCRVDDDNLNWILAEFLGQKTMLSLVCKTMDGVKMLESYDKNGSINTDIGLHGLGATIGRQLDGQYLVICLERLRPFTGHFIADDPQRRLDLRKPKLPNGETAPGFIGFAVNMISLDNSKLFCVTSTGCGLRETLFYHLFSSLQVYKTRADMLKALPLISNGAVSLDGGMMRRSGIFSLGSRENVDVKFPKSSRRLDLPEDYFEIQNKVKDSIWKKERLVDDMKREQELLDRTKHTFDAKKQEFVRFLAESSTYVSQNRLSTAP